MSIIEKALNSGQGKPHPEEQEAATNGRQGAPARPVSDSVVIDRRQLRASGVWPTPEMEQQLAGEYQRIKRPIVRNALGQASDTVPRGNLLAVTSSVDGEGKTFTAINLAVAISEEFDCEALLVDGDVVRRSASAILGVDDRLGLSDVLMDASLAPEDAILSTNIEGLSVLPAGQRHARSAELLSSQRQRDLMDHLASGHPNRVAIFDTPPMLMAAESVSIVDLVGQVALVVKAGGTQQSAVLRALEHMDTSKPVNLILNQTRAAQRGYYYGGYYGY